MLYRHSSACSNGGVLTAWLRKSRLLHKKVSAVVASADGCWALAADKFGDVYVAPLQQDQAADARGAVGGSSRGVEPAMVPSDAAVANGRQKGSATSKEQPAGSVIGGKAAVLLGHYNATITSLTVSPDGGSLVSTDRDGKARVSVFPSQPLQASDERCPF